MRVPETYQAAPEAIEAYRQPEGTYQAGPRSDLAVNLARKIPGPVRKTPDPAPSP